MGLLNLLTSGLPYWASGSPSDASVWDTASFSITGVGTVDLPGLAQVTAVWERDWQVAKTQGTDISYVTNKGLKPREFVMRLKITDGSQFAAFQQVINQLNLNTAGKTGAPIGLTHPYASILGVQFVVIKRLTLPEYNSQDPWVPVFNLIEWRRSRSRPRSQLRRLPGRGDCTRVCPTTHPGPTQGVP